VAVFFLNGEAAWLMAETKGSQLTQWSNRIGVEHTRDDQGKIPEVSAL
jgi:hypothetical protein